MLPPGAEMITVAGTPVLGWFNPAEQVVYFRPQDLTVDPGEILVVRGEARTVADVEQWNAGGTVAKLVDREPGYTTVTIQRPDPAIDAIQDPYGDGYGTASDIPNQWATVATGIQATITPSSGETIRPGDTEEVNYKLDADPCGLLHNDRVIDDATGEIYAVEWAHTSPGPRGRTTAGLRTFAGAYTTDDIEDLT